VADKITEQGFKTVFQLPQRMVGGLEPVCLPQRSSKEFNMKVGTLAFVYENGDGVRFASGWKKLAEKGGYKVVLDEPYPQL
jgi:branched-chain amino acid transport system substrate-binding protein